MPAAEPALGRYKWAFNVCHDLPMMLRLLLILTTGMALGCGKPSGGDRGATSEDRPVEVPQPTGDDSPRVVEEQAAGEVLAAVGPQSLSAAVTRAGAYLMGRPLLADSGWLAYRAAHVLGGDWVEWADRLEVAPRILEDAKLDPLREAEFRGLEGAFWKSRTMKRATWSKLPKPEGVTPEQPGAAMTAADLKDFLVIIKGMLVCERYKGGERTAWLSHLERPRTSYIVSHQLLAVGMGVERGCLTGASAEKLRGQLARKVYAELLGDGMTVDDLSVERAALLGYVGLGAWVDAEFVDAVAAAQAVDGSWGRRPRQLPEGAKIPAEPPPEHTAALAFYALATQWALRGEAVPAVPAR